jgi:hypothetical protein
VDKKMDEKMSHEQYVNSVREKIVQAAQAMLNGNLSYLLGARRMDSLRHDAKVKGDDKDFMVFAAIVSDTDDYPIGSVRDLWDKNALEKLQPDIDKAEAWAKQHAESVCMKLIERFS